MQEPRFGSDFWRSEEISWNEGVEKPGERVALACSALIFFLAIVKKGEGSGVPEPEFPPLSGLPAWRGEFGYKAGSSCCGRVPENSRPSRRCAE